MKKLKVFICNECECMFKIELDKEILIEDSNDDTNSEDYIEGFLKACELFGVEIKELKNGKYICRYCDY